MESKGKSSAPNTMQTSAINFITAGPYATQRKITHVLLNGVTMIGEATSTAANFLLANTGSDADDLYKEVRDYDADTPLRIMAKGMKAGLFVSGFEKSYRNDYLNQSKDPMPIQDDDKIAKMHRLKMAALGTRLAGNAFFTLPGVSSAIRGAGEAGIGIAELATKANDNNLISGLMAQGSYLFGLNEKGRKRFADERRWWYSIKQLALVGAKAVGNMTAAFGMDTAMFALNAPASMTMIAGGRVVAAVAEDWSNQIEKEELNKIVKGIKDTSLREGLKINTIKKPSKDLAELTVAATNRTVLMTGLERMMQPIFGLISLCFNGLKLWYTNFSEHATDEVAKNYQNAQIAAASSLYIGFDLGLERVLLDGLLRKAGICQIDTDISKMRQHLIKIEKERRRKLLPENETKTSHELEKEIQNWINNERENLKNSKKTTTPYRDLVRILIAMAKNEAGDLRKQLEAQIAALKQIQEPENWNEVTPLLQNVFKLLTFADSVEFLIASNPNPHIYEDDPSLKRNDKSKTSNGLIKDTEIFAKGLMIQHNAEPLPGDFKMENKTHVVKPEIFM